MNYVLDFAIVFLAAVGVLYFIFLFPKPSLKKTRKIKRNSADVQKLKKQLSDKSRSARQRADSFGSLISCGGILQHVLENEGGKFNDKKQSKRFCNSLTSSYVNRLNAVEGSHE